MDRLFVTGGARLAGSVHVSGAKNSALKLMAASLLAPGTSVVRNVPRIRDCGVMAEMLEHFGVRVTLRDGVAELDATHVDDVEAPDELVRQMRASIVVLGPLLARCGRARVSMPGGDEIGARPGRPARARARADGRDDPVRARVPAGRGRRAARRADHAGLPERHGHREPVVRGRARAGRHRDRQRRARARDRGRRELPRRDGGADPGRGVEHDRDRGRGRAQPDRPHRGARSHRGGDVGRGAPSPPRAT